MVAFPANPTTGQQYLRWIWDGSKWTPAPTAAPACGFFGINTSSPSPQVTLQPFRGNLIKLNGVIRQIPAGGIVSAGQNCFINGVLGNLVINTLYFVYVFDNNGTLALDFSTTGPLWSATAGNVGTPIKQGDDTRTCVGMCMPASAMPNCFFDTYTNRLVRSFYNRYPATLQVPPYTQAPLGGTSGAWVGIGQLNNFVQWADDALTLRLSASMSNTSGATQMSVAIGVNGQPLSDVGTITMDAPNVVCALGAQTSVNISSNSYNQFQILYQLQGASPASGTMAIYGTLNGPA